ncbi:MAG TPA: nucleotidyltransferase domain-containing protein [Gemmatimonadaceae bacterium]
MAKMTLDQLVAQLGGAFGDNLEAAVLYGSAARGENFREQSDLNVLVIVRELDLARLDAASATVRAWVDAGHPAPFILTHEEWRRSADIFPMEYADILDRHRVLAGTPPFEGIVVERGDLRRQLELEAMGKLLHLRKGAMAAAGDAKRQLALLEASRGVVLVIFRATLRLVGEVPAEDSVAVCRQVATLTGLDPAPFERVVRHAKGGGTLSRDETGAVLGTYLKGMETLVQYLDRHDAGAR